MNIIDYTISQIKDAISCKKHSASEITSAFLDNIEAGENDIHAFVEVYKYYALKRAQLVDDGKIAGTLAGVPIAIKDNMCTTFGHTQASSKMLEGFVAPYCATAVQRLEDNGAIIIGKTNMDEFAMGSSCENSAFGNTKNPWDKSKVPGGSSGGAAAAVAARFAPGALGSDTGGSIRQPGALCGVVGFKPTYGRVSRHGLIAFASSLDQIGPLTHTVKDAALIYQAIAGADKLDSTSSKQPIEDDICTLNKCPENLRIGIAKQLIDDNANSASQKEACQRAIEIYKQNGAEIVEIALPHTDYAIPAYYLVATAEASSNLARYDGVHYGRRAANPKDMADLYARSRAEGFGDEVKRRIMLGTYALSSGYHDEYYQKALKVRRLIKNDFDKAFETCDCVLMPTATGPAFDIGGKNEDPLAMYMNDVYTASANLAGIPAISLPAGFDKTGAKPLPIGIQLIAPAFEEAKLLSIANLFEKNSGNDN